MPAWLSNIDWIFYSLAALLGCAAAWLLHRGLNRDRARGKRRCPRCWYDLTGIPAKPAAAEPAEAPRWTCPECGHETTNERHLLKTRRHWLQASGGVFLAICSYAAAFAPQGIETGWTGLVPTTVLMYVAPPDAPFESLQFISQVGVITSTGLAPRWTTIKVALTTAMWERIAAGKAADWQTRTFMQRVLAKYPLDPKNFYRLPTCWLKGERMSIAVGYQPSSWSNLGPASRLSIEVTVPAGQSALVSSANGQWSGPYRLDLGSATVSTRIPIALRTLFIPSGGGEPIELARRTVQEEIRVATTAADVLAPENDPQVNARVQQLLSPRLLVAEGEIALVLGDRRDSPEWNRTRMFGCCTFTLRSQGKVIATGRIPGWSHYPVWKDWREIPVNFEPGAEAIVRSGAPIEAEFVGDPVASYERYAADPFSVSFDAAWTGRFTCTLPIVKSAQPGPAADPNAR